MSIVTVHLSLFSGDLHDAVIVGAIKMFEFPLEFISLIHEFLNDTRNVVDLAVVRQSRTA